MDLVEILASMITDDGLSVALIVGRDGLLVEGQSRGTGMDLQAVGAMSARALVDADRVGKTLSAGSVNRLRIRFESYLLSVETVTDSDILVAAVSNPADGERLFNALARHFTQIQHLLGAL
jgi:predicted regulator of Ras-like GTPase activity (Roadblock/LC7/MglB family)